MPFCGLYLFKSPIKTNNRSIFTVVALLPPFLTLNKYLIICLQNRDVNINYLLDNLRRRKIPSGKKYLKLTRNTLVLPPKFIFMLAITIPCQNKKNETN